MILPHLVFPVCDTFSLVPSVINENAKKHAVPFSQNFLDLKRMSFKLVTAKYGSQLVVWFQCDLLECVY